MYFNFTGNSVRKRYSNKCIFKADLRNKQSVMTKRRKI